MEIQTPEPGWKMPRSTARATSRAPEWPSDGWTKLGGGTVESRKQRFKLDTGDRRYRYYLVWITELPPDQRPRGDHAAHAVRRRSSTARSERVAAALGAVALEREAEQPVARLRARHARVASHSFGNADRARHARQRVELVDEHAPVVLDEEVDPRQAGAADAQERLDGQPAHAPRPTASGIRAGTRSSTPPSAYLAS